MQENTEGILVIRIAKYRITGNLTDSGQARPLREGGGISCLYECQTYGIKVSDSNVTKKGCLIRESNSMVAYSRSRQAIKYKWVLNVFNSLDGLQKAS